MPDGEQPLGALSCLERLDRSYASLGEADRRVAAYVMNQASQAVGLSITELARRSSVSEASVLRFARKLGYSGYRQFALALAAAVHPRSDPSMPDQSLELDIVESDEAMEIVRKVFAAEARALAGAWQGIDPAEWERAVAALTGARRVLCIAVGGSGMLALEAAYRFVRLGIDYFPIYDPMLIAIEAAGVTPQDVVIGLSQTGRTRDTVEGVRLAHGAGATTIAVTSRPNSPLVQFADIRLILREFHADYHGAHLDSKVAELTLIDALTACVARRLPARPQGAIDRLIASMDHAFVSETAGRSRAPKRDR